MGRRCPEALGALGQAGCEAVPGAVELRWSGQGVRWARSGCGASDGCVPPAAGWIPLVNSLFGRDNVFNFRVWFPYKRAQQLCEKGRVNSSPISPLGTGQQKEFLHHVSPLCLDVSDTFKGIWNSCCKLLYRHLNLTNRCDNSLSFLALPPFCIQIMQRLVKSLIPLATD
ncbi:uncharacterized protein [Anas acuta]|uniref:uncharacterized protein isoform X2 n=1 Tax=Anas acuta TaxID=28680 RepID=UPI0035C93490